MPLAAASLQRIRATRRAALNSAIGEGLLTASPARLVELANPHRPHPVVWTERRVAEWRQTGERPAVAVWTARQAAQFLDHVPEDRLFAVWWLIALRGLRRGEAAGLRWEDIDLDQRQLTITQQLTTAGPTLVASPPKSAERIAASDGWHETGYVFTRPNGLPLPADYLTQRCSSSGTTCRPSGSTTCATARPVSPTALVPI